MLYEIRECYTGKRHKVFEGTHEECENWLEMEDDPFQVFHDVEVSGSVAESG